MKRSMFLVVLLTCVFATAPAQQPVKSQDAVRASSEQSLQELVAEVRQLRAALQRMNAALYKGQVLLERVKLQQEQVMRISRELAQVREQTQEVRAQQQRMREMVGRVDSDVQAGAQRQAELAAIKGELQVLNQREVRMVVRETQLAAELEGERARLNDLNNKLNALVEIEMAPK
jgi:myosin heavy subunit